MWTTRIVFTQSYSRYYVCLCTPHHHGTTMHAMDTLQWWDIRLCSCRSMRRPIAVILAWVRQNWPVWAGIKLNVCMCMIQGGMCLRIIMSTYKVKKCYCGGVVSRESWVRLPPLHLTIATYTFWYVRKGRSKQFVEVITITACCMPPCKTHVLSDFVMC